MAAPEELRDRASHRVADGDRRGDAELLEQRGGVVGAVLEPEAAQAADPAPMPAQVRRDHAEALAERREDAPPVERRAREPAVEQQEHRRARRPRDLAEEDPAAAGKAQPAPLRQLRKLHRIHLDPPRGASPTRAAPVKTYLGGRAARETAFRPSRPDLLRSPTARCALASLACKEPVGARPA